jgi:DNA-binding CsgD family transcriptional regulator
MKRAAIEVIEAAYRSAGSTNDWLRAIASAMPKLPHALGHVCFTYRISPEGCVRFDDFLEVGTPGDLMAITRAAMEGMPPEYVRATFATVPYSTARAAGTAEARKFARAGLARTIGLVGAQDIVVLNGIDPTDQGIYIGALTGKEATLGRRDRSTWARVAAHLVASYRLRRAQTSDPEAVISPAGKVEHAIDDAKSKSARDALRTAALAIDRARTRTSRLDENEAVEMWHALVSGRWTLIDRIDGDGKRYFVARKNDPEVARHHELTRRERQVVGFAALGHSNKLIAYELGLSISAVAVYLELAIEKLGLASRAELIVAAPAFGAH